MKKRNFLGLALTLALIVLSAACSQTANVDHSKMDHNSMNHNSMPMNANMPANMNHNSMDHSSMKSDPNAAGAPFDLQFIDTMSHHHEGAIEMAEMVLRKSENAELKTFAQKIIDDQKKEIARLKDWRAQWFAGAAPAKNMEMPGMADSMKMMNADHMKMMDAMTGTDFDIHFLDMMIPHHEGATAMAKEAQQKSERAEIKTIAGEIIREQESEIKQMTDWKAKWAK